MGYNSKLTNLTNRAFDLLKDLATNATFIRKEGAFDFATGSTELTNSPNKIIKVVALESNSNDGKISLKLLVKYRLITRRSSVQIRPPLPIKTKGLRQKL